MSPDLDKIGAAVRVALSFAALIFAWRVVFVPTMVDSLRFRLFSVRRELFLLMSSGLLQPDDPAYLDLRLKINAWIEYAGKVTLPRIVWTVLVATIIREEPNEQVLSKAIAKIEDGSVRAKMADLNDRVERAILGHVVRTSPMCWFVLIPGCVLFALGILLVKKLRRGLHLVADPRPFVRFSRSTQPARYAFKSLESDAMLSRTCLH